MPFLVEHYISHALMGGDFMKNKPTKVDSSKQKKKNHACY
jgi:hypothetical protein